MQFGLFGIRQRSLFSRALTFGAVALLIAALFWFLRAPQPNVILITLDTTRADRLGAYGYQHGLTAGFDECAKRGVLFERAYAPAPITLPSHATIFTGLYPPEHGLRVNGVGRLSAEIPLLPELLKQRGYDTGGFIAAVVLDSKHGLNRGFDRYDDNLSKNADFTHFLERRRDGSEVVDAALSWMSSRRSRPFFCWMHLFDAHAPYRMRKEKYGDNFEEHAYDAGIATELEQVERVLSFLKERRIDRNTFVVIVGDHGEGLGAHHENEHGMQVYNSTLQVPLVFVGPHGCKAGHRVPYAVSLVDLTPTLLDLLGISAPKHFSGRSLRTALAGNRLEPRPCYAEAETPFAFNHWCPPQTLISDRWKFIRTTRPELYDLETDPSELRNLVDSAIEEHQQLQNTLDELVETFVPAKAQNLVLSEQDQANLMALGYVSGGTSHRDSEALKSEVLPDIKDKMPLVVLFEKARDLTLDRKYSDAISILLEIRKTGPDFIAASMLLGDCLAEVNRKDEASAVYEDVLSIRPEFVKARFNLAKIAARQGQFEPAIVEFRKVIEAEPDSAPAHFELGQALGSLKQFDQAIDEYRQAIRISPDFGAANMQLGLLLASRNQTDEAIACYEQVIRYEPKSSVARTHLQALLVKNRQFKRAIEQGRTLVEYEPASFDARFNLGVLLIAQHQYGEAIAQLKEAQKLRPNDPRPGQQIRQAEEAQRRLRVR